MRKITEKISCAAPVRRLLLLLLAFTLSQGVSAQCFKKQAVLADGSRELLTTQCCYARGGGFFGRRQLLAMSHVTSPTDSTSWHISLPLNLKKRSEIPEGSRMILKLQNDSVMELHCVKGVKKGDNYEELNHTFSVTPSFGLSDDALDLLLKSEVEAIGIETSRGNVTIARKDYLGYWRFTTMLQHCHNVLTWKLNEQREKLFSVRQ